MAAGASGSGGNEADIYQRILMFTGSNSRMGQRSLSREDYLRNLRKVFGLVSFKQVVEHLGQAQRDGLLLLEFLGPDDFKVTLTPFGLEVIKKVDQGESLADALSPVTALPPPPQDDSISAPPVPPLSGGDGQDLPSEDLPQEETPPPEAPEAETAVEPSTPSSDEEEVETEGEPAAETGSGEDPEVEPALDSETPEDEEAGPPANQEPITDLITSMQAHMAKAKGKTLPRPAERPAQPVRETEAPTSGRDNADFRLARENLEKRERALRERAKSLAQRETELIQREESFEETRTLLEEELEEAREETDRLSAEVKVRLPKLEADEARLSEREKVLEAKLSALEEREDAVLVHSKALSAHEDEAEELDERRINLRDQIREAHDRLVEHVKTTRKGK